MILRKQAFYYLDFNTTIIHLYRKCQKLHAHQQMRKFLGRGDRCQEERSGGRGEA